MRLWQDMLKHLFDGFGRAAHGARQARKITPWRANHPSSPRLSPPPGVASACLSQSIAKANDAKSRYICTAQRGKKVIASANSFQENVSQRVSNRISPLALGI
jgi:hypothetical protein